MQYLQTRLEQVLPREALRYPPRGRRYVARYTYVLVREWPVQDISTYPGTIWHGVRGRRKHQTYIVQVRGATLSVVYVHVGGDGLDLVATMVVMGAVAVLTVRTQCL